MKISLIGKLIFLMFLFIAQTNIAIAWECSYGGSVEQTDTETLFKSAKIVAFIQITKGELAEDGIRYSAKVISSLKGKSMSKIQLTDNGPTPPRQITIGNSYVIYLYDDTRIDFCTPLFPVWTPNNTIDELIDFSKREDMGHAKRIRETLILSKIFDDEDEKQLP